MVLGGSGSAPALRAAGCWCCPCGGRLEQVASRLTGFAGVFVQILLDSVLILVRIMGTGCVISAVDPREAQIQQGGIRA